MNFRNLAFGALAGISATMVMTMAMRNLYRFLPPEDRYPLPPREITETTLPTVARQDGAAAALLAHFGYGALTGALYAGLPRRKLPGFVYGPAVWAASYFILFPGSGILKTADKHPRRRNGLMILAHVVWGQALSGGLNALHKAAEDGFDSGPLRDARSGAGHRKVDRPRFRPEGRSPPMRPVSEKDPGA